MRQPMAVFFAFFLATSALGSEPTSGWRGNMTGLWPSAKPVLHWHRLPRGAMEGLRSSATAPKGAESGDLVERGLPCNWSILGPFVVADSVRDFDRDLLENEADLEPSPKEIQSRTWKEWTAPADDYLVFGTAELPWLDLAKPMGFENNQFGYAHTYLFSKRGGPARVVLDHGFGLKAWVNGKEVYRCAQRAMGLGFYTQISRHELNHSKAPSPRFDMQLKPGWNRLLLRLTTANKKGFTDMRVTMRIMDPPDVAHESKNIVWMTPLPGRSTSTPILVVDNLIVLAEPDEVLCLDKNTGKMRWSAAVNYYEALTPEEHKANPDFARRVDPLLARLHAEKEAGKRLGLRKQIQKTLLELDEARFRIQTSGHFESHFGIVGFTMPTPVSDGKRVFVWNGMGVAACFDLKGKRQWITRLKTNDELNYGSSPALADGVLVVFQNGLHGFDAATGEHLWKSLKIKNNVAALLGARIAGQPVVVTQRGDLIRPSDGKVLYRPRDSGATGDTGWAPPVVLGNRVYQPRHGVLNLQAHDYAAATPENWEPKMLASMHMPPEVSRGPGGKWIDRWTAGSPLVWDGIAYQTDIYQEFYANDLKTGKLHYRTTLDLQGYTHYNAVAVAASPTLLGSHIFQSDNQGVTLILQPGAKFKVVARNHLATQIDRPWPISPQETIGYAPPVADGHRFFLRGEAYLYCIGQK